MDHRRKVRLTDVARAAGVSISTASRALRGEGRIAETTRRRVLAEAERLGYVTEREPAASTVSGGVQQIASKLTIPGLNRLLVGVPQIGYDAFYGATVVAISQEGTRRGFHVDIDSLDNRRDLADAVAKIESEPYDALVVCTWDALDVTDCAVLTQTTKPVVLINRHIEGHAYTVTHDDFAAGLLAARHLIDLGHRRIAHLAGPQSASPLRERTAGFRAGLERAGLFDPQLLVLGINGNHVDWVVQTMDQLMSLPEPPTAVWAFNDNVAAHVVATARTRGLQVPQDLSVMGFDNLPYSNSIGLTTFQFRSRDLGLQAVHLLHGVFTQTVVPPVRVCVVPHLIVRDTTGPAPS